MNSSVNLQALEANIAAADKGADHEATSLASVSDDAGQKAIWWSNQNAMTISAAVLIFGAVVIAIAARNTPSDTSLEAKLRLYGTVMVITMAAFLVVAGYDDNQIAAPLGLLGTIAGYLLGQRSPPPSPGGPPGPGPASTHHTDRRAPTEDAGLE